MVVQIIETTSLGYTEHRKGLETDASGPLHVFGSVFKIGAILKVGWPFVNKKNGPCRLPENWRKESAVRDSGPTSGALVSTGGQAWRGLGPKRLSTRVAGRLHQGGFPLPQRPRKAAPWVAG
jgi:hypothetical protein